MNTVITPLVRRSLLLLVFLPFILSLAHAQGPGRCGEPTIFARSRAFVVVDANSGNVIEGRTRFTRGEKIQVIVRNRNPYRYAYRTGASTAPLPSLISGDFLAPMIADLKEYTGATQLQLNTLGLECSPEERRPGAGVASRIAAVTKEIDGDLDGIKRTLESNLRQHDDFLRQITSDRLYCEKALADGRKLLPLLDRLIEPAETVSQLERVGEKVVRLDRLYDDLLNSLDTTSNACRQSATETQIAESRRVRANLGALIDAVRKVMARKQDLVDLATIIAAVTEDSFTDVIEPVVDGSQDAVMIDFYRRDLLARSAPETNVGSVRLELSDSRIVSLSAGVGFSTLGETTYGTRQGLVPVRDGSGAIVSDSIGTVIGFDRRSSAIPLPMLQVNFHVLRWSGAGTTDVSLGASLGYVVGSEVLGDDAQYVAGLTFGAANDRLLFSLGAHWRRTESLADGFVVGEEVPSGLETIPVERNYRTGFVMTLTGRLW